MGQTCTKTVTTVIPDRDSMVAVVDLILEFEEILKKGEDLTRSQERQRKAADKVVKDIRRVTKLK